jgi:L-fuconolactonase
MQRRDFLTCASAAAGTLLLPALRSAPAATAAIPVIDTHTHFFDPTRPQGVPWPPQTDSLLHRPHLPADFRRVVAGLPIVGTVVVEASEWVADNDWILSLAVQNPEIVGLVGNLRPGQPEFAAQLARLARNPLFRGLRFRPGDLRGADNPASAADLRRLADADLSLDALGGTAVLEPTLRLARAFPSLRIVINHLPFKDWDGNPAALRSGLRELAAQPSVFAKVSDVVRRVNGNVVDDPAFYRPGLDALLDLFGPDRVIFGSNWPVSDRVAPYATLHRVVSEYFTARGRDVAEKYFWRNALTAYRWQPRGAAAALVRS